MTHTDIYTKFMIEYDKANVTSSYPSLTEYEVATVLDKAYNALIAQKVTGNNMRRAPFEADVKAVSDLLGLVVKDPSIEVEEDSAQGMEELKSLAHDNIAKASLPEDFLYFISAGYYKEYDFNNGNRPKPMDYTPYNYNVQYTFVPIKLVTHAVAEKFMRTSHNIPWIKDPVCYLENNMMFVLYDPIEVISSDRFIKTSDPYKISLTYIKKPNPFVKSLEDLEPAKSGEVRTYFTIKDATGKDISATNSAYIFELNDTVAEELISLAIAFALENVESQRLNTKLNMRGLEA